MPKPDRSTPEPAAARDDDRLALLPDIPAEITRDDYATGRDPVLEAAFGG